jgi:hypothetical protein
MDFVQSASMFAFAAFSLVDIRVRRAPLIDFVFYLCLLRVAPTSPWHALAVCAAVAWGAFNVVPGFLAIPLLVLYPPSWPLLLVGYGTRSLVVGRADLFALGIIGLLFPFPAQVIALLGFEAWRRFWARNGRFGFLPAIPGLFIGLSAYYIAARILAAYVG